MRVHRGHSQTTRRASRLGRLVAVVAALGQLLVATAAWADAADNASTWNARPHVEQDGVRLHHAHVESECALCAAQHIVSSAPPRAGRVPAPAAAHRAPVARLVRPALRAPRGRRLSRAPPTAV